jgi:endonuclease-3
MNIHKIIETLKSLYPEAICSLEYGGDAWRLLAAARLSAQCTDERVNIVCRPLFERYPDVYAMAEAEIGELESIIRPCGLYHTKAESLIASAKLIVDAFDGRVPDEIEDLLTLPGVGRKIANLIVGDLYGKPAVVTDTHCIRICGRLGFYPEELKDPYKIEKILAAVIEPKEQSDFCHRIVWFGREVCTARSPRCEGCPLRDICEHGKAQ